MCLRTFSWILERHRAPGARSAAPLPEQKPLELRAPGVAARPPAAAVAWTALALALALAEMVALAEAEAGEGGRPAAP